MGSHRIGQPGLAGQGSGLDFVRPPAPYAECLHVSFDQLVIDW